MAKRTRRTASIGLESSLAHWLGGVLLLLVVLAPVTSTLGSHLFFKESVIEMFVAASFIAFTLRYPAYRPLVPRHLLTAVAIGVIAWGTLSLLWAEKPGYGVVHLLRWVIAGAIALAAFQLRRSRDVTLVFRYLFAAGIVVTLLGCIQHLTGFSGIPQARGPAATFVNRNVAMHVVILTWVFGPALMLMEGNRGSVRHYCYAAGTALAIVFATYTQTRAAWLSMLGQVILFALFFAAARLRGIDTATQVDRGAALFGAIVLVVLINLGPGGFDPIFGRVSDRAASIGEVAAQGKDGEPFERFVIWGSALHMAGDHPWVGVGPGNFQAVHPDYAVGDTINITYVHNDYLQTVVELGVPGALLMIAALSWLTWFGARVFFVERSPDTGIVMILVALAGIATDALFSFPLQLTGGLVIVAMLLGLMLRLSLPIDDPACRRFEFPGKWTAAALTAPVTIAIVTLNVNWSIVLDDFETNAESATWRRPVDLDTWVEHPMFVKFVKVLAQRYQSDEPAKAEMVARSYYAVDDENVIVNNTLALSLILQGNYDEADGILGATRPLEPWGYFRSYENEQVLAQQSGDMDRLRATLETVMAMPHDVVSTQASTLSNLARTAFNLGDRERAVAMLQQNLERHPRHMDTHRTLLLILGRMGRIDETRAHLSELERYGLSEEQRESLQSQYRS